MFEYLETKKANELKVDDFITLSGHIDEIAAIEYIDPEGDEVAIRTNDGRGKYFDGIEPVKVYTL